jgi:hypothetical protein
MRELVEVGERLVSPDRLFICGLTGYHGTMFFLKISDLVNNQVSQVDYTDDQVVFYNGGRGPKNVVAVVSFRILLQLTI